MKILFVSALLPYPLNSGGQVRLYNLIKRLSRHHEITLLSFIRDDNERQWKNALSFCHDVIMVHRGFAWQPSYMMRALVGRYPFLLTTYDNTQMKKELNQRFEKKSFDILHLEPFYVMASLPSFSVPTVISEHNIEYAVYEKYVRSFPIPILRPVLALDVAKMRYWEEYAWRNADAVTAVSEVDAAIISRYVSHDIPVVPNGVDIDHFRFRTPPSPRKRALFVGNFRWLPNVEAGKRLVDEIWPAVKQRYPQAHLTIAGKDLPDTLIRQAKRQGVEIKKDVVDIRSVYEQADVLIAPHTIGGGTKFKMLEAMATGVPIVTTTEGMVGTAADPQIHYLEAYSVEEFVAQTGQIWENKRVRETLARNARKLVEEHYGWDRISSTLDTIWRKTYEQRRG